LLLTIADYRQGNVSHLDVTETTQQTMRAHYSATGSGLHLHGHRPRHLPINHRVSIGCHKPRQHGRNDRDNSFVGRFDC
jgi:hypothetical protein